MKTTIKETTTINNLFSLIWGIFILTGTSYLVFFKNESHWWFVLAVSLVFASFYIKKTEIE